MIQVPFILEITNLIESEIFSIDKMSPLTGSFKLVLRHWLNIASSFFKNYGLVKELSQTKNLAMLVIANEVNIRDIWVSIDQGKKSDSLGMFEDLIEQPTKNFEEFLDLADALCGKKYYAHAKDVLKILFTKKP